MADINFDEWAELYKTHPEEFERKRKALLDAEILKAPIKNRHKLRMLQTECDAYRATYSPLQAAEKMCKLLVEKAFEIQDSVLDLGIECKNFDAISKTVDK